jgi:quercetin dioxygenase-like cupin family protein
MLANGKARKQWGRKGATMLRHPDTEGYKVVLEGVRFKTLVHGERTHLTEFRLSKGAVVPEHQHAEEQTGYLISGSLRFNVDGEVSVAAPGTSWNIPSGTPHGAEALEDAVVVEVFSPVREDYLS